MDTTHHDHRTEATQAPTSGRPIKVALAMVALIGAFYLLREHWDHVAGAWIYLLLLACPLMHLFHRHGGHGGHRHGAPADRDARAPGGSVGPPAERPAGARPPHSQ